MGGKGSGQPKDKLVPAQAKEISMTPSEKFTQVNNFLVVIGEISRHADRNNIDTLYECARQYLEACQMYKMMPTNAGIYAACNVNTKDISDWYSGKKFRNKPEYRQFANYVKNICRTAREIAMTNKAIPEIVGIFWQKAYDRLSDQPQPEIEFQEEENKDIEAIKAKYANMIVED